MRLVNRVALITGGNRGIGLATAQLFTQEGAQVVLFARDQTKGESEAAKIPNARFIQGDVTKAEDCQRAVEETAKAFGGLDILVNCAGIIFRFGKIHAHRPVICHKPATLLDRVQERRHVRVTDKWLRVALYQSIVKLI